MEEILSKAAGVVEDKEFDVRLARQWGCSCSCVCTGDGRNDVDGQGAVNSAGQNNPCKCSCGGNVDANDAAACSK